MFKLKIFLKTSTKKLKKLSVFKEKTLTSLIYFLTKERNKHFDIIKKHLKIFLASLNSLAENDVLIDKLINNLFIKNIEYLNSRSLKRLNIRAKGKADIITKKNSYLVISISRYKILTDTQLIRKNYLIKTYGKKN